ncbi:MAG: polysaccharide deacetylase family protein [bacterium]|nr:polysaccharide deacetylase family protein [bacterium]
MKKQILREKHKRVTGKKRIAGLLLALLFGLCTQTALAQELPEGYHWVSEGGPSGAKLVDGQGNEVDYATLLQENPNLANGASGPAALETADAQQQQTDEAKESESLGTETETEQETNAQQETDAETESEEANNDNPRGIDPQKPMVALTFDDGPYAPVGNRIMDVMQQYNSRCTFFVVGERVPLYTKELRRMVEEGFEIANHTQNHKYLNKLGAAAIRSQVEQCNAAVASVTGVTPTLVRLPGGNSSRTVLANVNYPIILWSIDTKDWSHRNTQKTIDIVKSKVKDGDIILMHELYTATAAATEQLVPWLVEQGYQLVTVSELIAYKGVTVQPNTIYHSFH